MSGGREKYARFKTVRPMVNYFYPYQIENLKKFARVNGRSVTQVVREAVDVRLAGSGERSQYEEGLKEGLEKARSIALNSEGADMRFPNGRSFGEIVYDNVTKFIDERFK